MNKNKILLLIVFFKITVYCLFLLMMIMGCKSFTADPHTFIFEGISWRVNSAELANQFRYPPYKPESESEVFLIVQFDVQGSLVPRIKAESLREEFGEVVLSKSGKKPIQFFPHSEKNNGPIDYMTCVFIVPRETSSIKLVLPNSQDITIMIKG